MKKIKEPKAMRELHEIREKMYSETADMSMHERLMFVKEKAESYKAKSGLKLRPFKTKEEKSKKG